MAQPPAKSERMPKPRKFYKMGPDFRTGGSPGFDIENIDALLQGRNSLGPPPGERGFPAFVEPPRLLVDRKLGRPMRDLEIFHDYWVISDRMKGVLEAMDRDAFTFLRCEVRIAESGSTPTYWFCDVLRILDALDESASRLKIYYDNETGEKIYSLMGSASLVFKESVVGTAHVFRMAHLEPAIFCDQLLKDSCRSAKLRGVVFRDASEC